MALRPVSLIHRRRSLIAGLVLVTIAALSLSRTLTYASFSARAGEPTIFTASPLVCVDKTYESARALNGAPTASFRDNLKVDRKYITSWTSAGWTNDVATYINLIYLGLITERIPIVPDFLPSHIGVHVPPIPFGDVFDLPRLRNQLGTAVLEWRDVKDVNSTFVDDLGCWNVWEAVQFRHAHPRDSWHPTHLGLDISYTKVPAWVKLMPDSEHDYHATFWALATLAFPSGRKANMVPPSPSPEHHSLLAPDEQLLCYDFLYYVVAHQVLFLTEEQSGSDRQHGSPAWRSVGTHMHWNPSLEELAESYLRAAMRLPEESPLVPFISVHVRHADFESWCNGIPVKQCFASLAAINRQVQQIRAEMLRLSGVRIHHVVMTSDEKDAIWWHDVAELGWLRIDHSRTAHIYGEWYPVLIDAVIQSKGAAFVGTDRSSMSVLAGRRVEDWQNGLSALVKWGTPTSDDH
ncbi:unnamed protein product [Mycena citricolor]|uniref:Uncharacterized protein n=1 Tax=Mycena citricolor TaxID=2018698 RepID=A0AAD2HT14_9AGAR|nr:unnamed protein product [Mycena citricolor]